MGDGVDLMGPELDGRVDAHEVEMAPVIFPGPDAVEFLIVEPRQPVPAVLVFPDPILKRLFDELLLALGDGRLLLVEHGDPVAMLVLDVIKDTDGTQV